MSRFNIILNKKADELLAALVKKTGKSKADIFREGLVLAEYAERQKEQGKSLAVVKNNKIEKELILL